MALDNEIAKQNIHQRLAQVMQAVSYIQKEHKSGMKYTIVSHDKVTALVRPEFLRAGIINYIAECNHAHNGNRSECDITLRYANIDDPSDFIDVKSYGYGVDGQDKGPGKAMSYAVKYAHLKTLGLETGDDPDHHSVDHSLEDPHRIKERQPSDIAAELKAKIEAQKTIADLVALKATPGFKKDFNRLPDGMFNEIVAVGKAKKDSLESNNRPRNHATELYNEMAGNIKNTSQPDTIPGNQHYMRELERLRKMDAGLAAKISTLVADTISNLEPA